MPTISEKEQYRIRRLARHEIGHFNSRAWLALARLLGLHFPFDDADKVDFLAEIKTRFIAGAEYRKKE